MDEWGFSILRPFHQYYNYIGTLKGDRGDNDKRACNGASFMSLNANPLDLPGLLQISLASSAVA